MVYTQGLTHIHAHTPGVCSQSADSSVLVEIMFIFPSKSEWLQEIQQCYAKRKRERERKREGGLVATLLWFISTNIKERGFLHTHDVHYLLLL